MLANWQWVIEIVTDNDTLYYDYASVSDLVSSYFEVIGMTFRNTHLYIKF